MEKKLNASPSTNFDVSDRFFELRCASFYLAVESFSAPPDPPTFWYFQWRFPTEIPAIASKKDYE